MKYSIPIPLQQAHQAQHDEVMYPPAVLHLQHVWLRLGQRADNGVTT